MSPPNLLPRARRGFGLLEVILVFAIILGSSAVIFEVAKSAEASSQASEEADLLNTAIGNLHSTLGMMHDYQGLGTAYSTGSAYNNAAGISLLSKVYAVTGTVAKSPTGMSVTVNNWRDYFVLPGAAPDTYYMATLSGIPPDLCPKLLASIIGNGSNFVGVAISSPGSSSYGWVALQNKQAANNMGYHTNMQTPSPSDYVSTCQSEYDYGHGIAVIVVGT